MLCLAVGSLDTRWEARAAVAQNSEGPNNWKQAQRKRELGFLSDCSVGINIY